MQDRSEPTMTLGPLDTFPAPRDEITQIARPCIARLANGDPVLVRGASVVPAPPVAEEEGFVLGPSPSLRARRFLRALALRRRVAALEELRAARAHVRAAAHALRARLGGLGVAAMEIVADARRIDGAQRRTAVRAFVTGVALSVLATWIW